jgi:Na+(H+)/acetate symporter ActP
VLRNPAIFSMPLAFVVAVLVSLLAPDQLPALRAVWPGSLAVVGAGA